MLEYFVRTIRRAWPYGAVMCIVVAAAASAAIGVDTTGSSGGAIVSGINKGSGVGVKGAAVKNNGVIGLTYAVGKTAWAGVMGTDATIRHPDVNFGVAGLSQKGSGVLGKTFTNDTNDGQFGVLGVDGASSSTANAGVQGQSNAGLGVAGIADTGGSANGIPLAAFNPSTPNCSASSSQPIEAAAFAPSGGTFSSVMLLDECGNLQLNGTVVTSAAAIVVKSSSGRKAIAYASQQASPTMEDAGEATLTNGYARVALDPAFASTIDRTHPYLVFLTPEGMTNGILCVVARDASGFTVRENMGGRSSVAFDYRIVARPYGSSAPRLPQYRSSTIYSNAAGRVR